MFRFLAVAIVALALSACASAPQVNQDYAAYLDVVKEQRAARDAQIAGVAAVAQACGADARCVEHVGSMAAMAMMGAGMSQQQAAPPPKQISGAEKFATVMSAMTPMLGTVMNGVVSMRQTEASRDTSEALYGMLGGAIRDTTGGMATVAAGAQPNVTVGGDYVQGNGNQTVRGQIGDSAGRDQISGTQYQGPVIGRDNAGRDLIRDANVGPGCTGDGCQPVTNTNEPAEE